MGTAPSLSGVLFLDLGLSGALGADLDELSCRRVSCREKPTSAGRWGTEMRYQACWLALVWFVGVLLLLLVPLADRFLLIVLVSMLASGFHKERKKRRRRSRSTQGRANTNWAIVGWSSLPGSNP